MNNRTSALASRLLCPAPMKIKAIVMGLLLCTSLVACATSETDGEPTTITPAQVEHDQAGGATITGDGVTVDVDPAMLELFSIETPDGVSYQRVGCQISECDACTCYPDGKCICTNCKCIAR